MNPPRRDLAPIRREPRADDVVPLTLLPSGVAVPVPPMQGPPPGPSALLALADHILQHFRLAVLLWLVAMAAGVFYLLVTAPLYRAESLVQIASRNARPMATLSQTPGVPEAGPSGFIQGEIEILRSREIVGKAIAQTGADRQMEVDNRAPIVGEWFARRADAARGPAAPPFDAAFLNGFAWGGETLRLAALRVPDSLHGQPIVLQAGDAGAWTLRDEGDRVLARGGLGEEQRFPVDGEAAVIQVQALSAHPGTRFRIVTSNPDQVYDDLQRALRIEEAGRQSGVIRISLNHGDPRFAAGFIDAMTTAYLQHHLKVHTGEASQALQFLEAQLPAVKQQLDRAEEALDRYRTGTNTINVGLETENTLRRIADLERDRMQVEMRKEDVLRRFTPSHSEAIALQKQLGTISVELLKLRGQMRASPRQEKDVVRLQRDVAVNTQLYTALLNNAQELRIAQAGMTGNARLVDRASVLAQPVAPKFGTVIAVSASLGVVLALAGVLFARLLRPTVRTAEELERSTGLATLVSIPESAAQRDLMRSHWLWRTRARTRILAVRAPLDAAVESLRALRNSIAMNTAEHASLLVTAATTEAGKSFVAANLAVLTAAAGRRVLLVDLDLRSPMLHAYFGVDRDRTGLVDVIEQRAGIDAAILQEVLPGLDLLLPGRLAASPGELLMSPRFDSLMADLHGRYAQVIIDSAPVLPVGDSLAIGRLVDATYLVVRSESNTQREVRDAVRRLQAASVAVDGFVLNGVKRGRLASVPYRGYYPREIALR